MLFLFSIFFSPLAVVYYSVLFALLAWIGAWWCGVCALQCVACLGGGVLAFTLLTPEPSSAGF